MELAPSSAGDTEAAQEDLLAKCVLEMPLPFCGCFWKFYAQAQRLKWQMRLVLYLWLCLSDPLDTMPHLPVPTCGI